MGKLLTAVRRLNKRTAAAVAVIAAAVVVPATLFAWGPDRPTYTIDNPSDHITFNSITNNPNIGDERNFVGIREAGTNTTWNDTMPVQPGKEYVVRMYVHNNAASSLNLVAQNVTAKFNLPTNTAKSLQVNGFIDSSNASPSEVYDHATFTSDQDFNLAYQAGTLKYYNNASGQQGFTIPESVFTSNGALLGYDKMDGKIPGCFQYAGYLTFVVKPQFATPPTPNFNLNKEVRKAGDKNFVESINANPGDTLNYRVTVNNSGATQLNNINLKDTLPKGVTNVPGTVRILNANNPGGATIQDGDKLFSSGVNIGSYTAGSNAIVIFDATVAKNDDLPVCGPNKLTNTASAQPEGQGSKSDTADVTVPKECQPEAKYTCDNLSVTQIDRTNFKFDTQYSVENATFKNVTYVIRDESGNEIARTNNPNYSQDKLGKYSVEAIVTVTVNGQDKTVSGDNCKKSFEVVEAPAYTCDSLTVTKIDRTNFKFDTKYTVKNATFKSLVYVIRDENGNEIARTNDATYTQTKPGNYSVEAIVTVTVDSQDKVAAGDCKKAFEVTQEECKPGIPVGDTRCQEECKPGIPVGDERCEEKPECKPGIPMNDERCKETPPCVPSASNNNCGEAPKSTPPTPTELPKTGIGNGIAALVGAGSLIAAIGYYIASRRQLG